MNNLSDMKATVSTTSSNSNNQSKGMKRTHSIEIIEPTIKRISTGASQNDDIIIDNEPSRSNAASASSVTNANDSGRYSREEVRDLFLRLRQMFPQKTDIVIKSVVQRHLYNLDLNTICNELIEDKSANRREINMRSNAGVMVRSDDQPTTSSKATLDDDLEKILQIVPDCDPEYIKDQLKQLPSGTNRADALVTRLIETKTYPRLKDKQLASKISNKLDSLLNMEISFDDFLKMYPNPIEYFNSGSLNKNNTNLNYKEHCRVYLSNKFSKLSNTSIDKVLKKNNFYFLPSVKQIEEALTFKSIKMSEVIRNSVNPSQVNNRYDNDLNNNNYRFIKKKNFQRKYIIYEILEVPRSFTPYPNELEEKFFKELFFYRNEDKINEYFKQKVQERACKVEEARNNNLLCECECCYTNELLLEDMIKCDNGHEYCMECVKKYIETSIGEGKYEFKCVDAKCDIEYRVNILSQVLDQNVLNNVLYNIQQEEIRKAGIENLETCKYCNYAAIIDNPDEKIFTCLNPNCLKETCRSCKEPAHIPLRCDEVENRKEVNMRIFIENRVSEAMIRICYQCNKRFFKNEGCNHIKCACGAEMCYICKEPIKGYHHFHNNLKGCVQFNDVSVLHQQEMKKAYDEAVKIYKIENPQAADVNLKYDPKKLLDELQSKTSLPTINELPPQHYVFPLNIGILHQAPPTVTFNYIIDEYNALERMIRMPVMQPLPPRQPQMPLIMTNNQVELTLSDNNDSDSDSENSDIMTNDVSSTSGSSRSVIVTNNSLHNGQEFRAVSMLVSDEDEDVDILNSTTFI